MWDFPLEAGVTLHVWRGSGHWANTINTKTSVIGKPVYVYEAEIEYADGQLSRLPISRNQLRQARRLVAKLA